MKPITVQVDTRRRRVVVSLPLAASEMTPDGWLFRMVYAVCGKDAVVDALVGTHLGALALCAKGESQAWRDELKLSVDPTPEKV